MSGALLTLLQMSKRRATASAPLRLRLAARSRCAESREAECRVGLLRTQYRGCHNFSDDGSHFETVAGSAADDPDVLRARMAVDDEMRIRRRFVLADFGAKKRCGSKARKTFRHEPLHG